MTQFLFLYTVIATDRLLETTETVAHRDMEAQLLDNMDLERGACGAWEGKRMDQYIEVVTVSTV
jgi:hypothetical protein